MNEKEQSRRSLLLKISKIVFVILIAVFLARWFYRNYDDIKKLDFRPNWTLFLPSLVFFFLYKLLQASLWHYITVLNGAAISYKGGVKAYLYSILGKYIPGKVFMLLARIPPYQEKGVSAGKITMCFLLENVCTILGAGMLFILSLFMFPMEEFQQYKWLTIVLIIVFIICINPAILNFFLGLLEKIVKKKVSRIQITYPQMLKVVLLFVLNWVIYGAGFYLMICSFYPLPISRWLYVSGVYALSCIAGILAIFSPSGLGVREGVMLLGLGLVMDHNMAVMLSLIARLWADVSELSLVGIVFIVDKVKGLAAKRTQA